MFKYKKLGASESIYNSGIKNESQGMDRERVETMNVYGNTDSVRDHDLKTETEDSNTNRYKPIQHTGSECVRSRSSRAATVCLGLLCVLLLAAVIVLCVQISTERDQFHIKSKNYTEERDQLLTKITNLTEEREQLLTKNTKLTEERDQLLTKNINLTRERDGLLSQNNELWKRLCEKDGWIYYQFSCYYLPSGWKSWSESRQDCLQRGADLMIINNIEEQEFVRKKFSVDNVWIGLSDSTDEGTWKWVDGSTLTSGFRFWKPGEPNSHVGEEDCAVSASSGWIDCPCHFKYKWICVKSPVKYHVN